MSFTACAVSASSKELCDDVRLALTRAGISMKAAAISIGSPLPKLSEQLSGQTPFTLFWRFAHLDVRFWEELVALRARRLGRDLVSCDLAALLDGVERLTKRMAKADIGIVDDERKAG